MGVHVCEFTCVSVCVMSGETWKYHYIPNPFIVLFSFWGKGTDINGKEALCVGNR